MARRPAFTTTSPLTWPEGRPRTEHPRASRFGARTFHAALDDVLLELGRMGASGIVVTASLRFRQHDGMPYAGEANRRDVDPGLAIYFRRAGEDHVIACDAWRSTAENLRAIALHLGAMRGLERWGCATLDQMFQGFRALPAGAAAARRRPWHEVLGVAPAAPREVVRAAWSALVRRHHPDHGGDPEDFREVQRAWEDFSAGHRQEIGSG